jgi:FkbM family methyltransferase
MPMPQALTTSDREKLLVQEFFGDTKGFFVEVGANDPQQGSQSWHLEQAGWRGVLVEPQPELAARLRKTRNAKVFAVACSSPDYAGRELSLHVAGPMSALDRDRMAPGAIPEATVTVPVRTLDDILTEAGAPRPLDFLSVDVEGHEIEVLSGFDFARWRPRLILLEDHVANLVKHRFLRRAHYRLVRRTDSNGWYVSDTEKISFGWPDRWELWRKYYLALPFRMLRNFSRRLRQPAKDRRKAQGRSAALAEK